MGPSKHEEIYRLRYSDFSRYDTLTPHAVLDIFQDLAGEHADLIKVGFNDMLKKNLYWVLMRTKFIVEKPIPLYSIVLATTWPKNKGRVDFDREYEIIDPETKEVLIKGINKWIVIDTKTRRIAMTKDVDYDCEILAKENFPGNFPKLPDFDIEGISPFIQETSYSDLDHNGHINNANYARYILNAVQLKEDEIMHEFQIDHIHELEADSKVKIYVKRQNKCIFAKGLKENGEISFNSIIKLF